VPFLHFNKEINMNILKVSALLIFLSLSLNLHAGSYPFERETSYPVKGDAVTWWCNPSVQNSSINYYYCRINNNSLSGASNGLRISPNGYNRYTWDKGGVYFSSIGLEKCNSVSCRLDMTNTIKTIVAPSESGWNPKFYTNKTTAKVGEDIIFYAGMDESESCCYAQINFGDGSSREVKAYNGVISSTKKAYFQPGDYLVKMYLEDFQDEDIRQPNGDRAEKTVLIKVLPGPSLPPVDNFQANILRKGYTNVELYAEDQQGSLWYNHHTDTANSTPIQWSKSSDAKYTEIQYRVDYGTVGKNADLKDIDWELYRKTKEESGYIVALPPKVVEQYYNNQLQITDERYDPTSQDFIMVYYRFRVIDSDNKASQWGYTKGIWYWYKD